MHGQGLYGKMSQNIDNLLKSFYLQDLPQLDSLIDNLKNTLSIDCKGQFK
jgi:hypothetical protein